ncbi:MAG: hypothetical protein WB919_05225, partial [Candidatus Sulfotelmatobacter sp.]
ISNNPEDLTNPFAASETLGRQECETGQIFHHNQIKEMSMKKLMVCLLAIAFALSLTAFAQQDNNASQNNNMSQAQADQSAAKAPLMTLKGTVKAEGDKYTFVNDKDGKSWDVMNPEELKGHEGHHVQLSAHVYADKGSIHIMSVKMLKGGSMGNDSMSK